MSFVNVAGRLGHVIHDFFNNTRNQAVRANQLHHVIRNLNKIIAYGIVLANNLHKFSQNGYYTAAVINNRLLVVPRSFSSRQLAVDTFVALGWFSTNGLPSGVLGQTVAGGGIFTRSATSARDIAGRANLRGRPFREIGKWIGHFWHYHSFERKPSNGHAWFVG